MITLRLHKSVIVINTILALLTRYEIKKQQNFYFDVLKNRLLMKIYEMGGFQRAGTGKNKKSHRNLPPASILVCGSGNKISLKNHNFS